MCTALQLGGDVEQPWLMTSSINRKYITYHYAARGEPSHVHNVTGIKKFMTAACAEGPWWAVGSDSGSTDCWAARNLIRDLPIYGTVIGDRGLVP